MSRITVGAMHANWLTLLFAVSISGCIAPHSVKPEIEITEEVEFRESVLITAGPRELLENLTEKIERLDPEISIADGLEFRDAAFPDGGWRLADFVSNAERREQVAETLGVDYLVVLGPAKIEERTDEEGGYPVIVPGVMSANVTSVLDAIIIDLATGDTLMRLTTTAAGRFRSANYMIYWVGTDPMTKTAVFSGFTDAMVESLRERHASGPIRIALLAADSVGTPFRSPAPDYTAAADGQAFGPEDELRAVNRLRSVAVYDGLEQRDGIYFEAGAGEPYTGVRTTYYDNGQRAAEMEFVAGLEHGLFSIWDVDGAKLRDTSYREGTLDGLDTGWYGNGRKRFVHSFRKGKAHGVSTRWKKSGSIAWQVCYRDGELTDRKARDCSD